MEKGSEVFARMKSGETCTVLVAWEDYEITRVEIDGEKVENDIVKIKEGLLDIPYAYVFKAMDEEDSFTFTFGKLKDGSEGVAYTI